MSTKAIRSEIHERSLDHSKKYVADHLGCLSDAAAIIENITDESDEIPSKLSSVISTAISDKQSEQEIVAVAKEDKQEAKEKAVKNALISSQKKKEEMKKKK